MGSSPADAPQVSVDSDGNILVIWEMQSGGHQDIMARYYDASTSVWDGIKTLDTRTDNANSPQIAFNSQGNAFATWVQNDGSHLSPYVSYFTKSSGNWGTPYTIDNDNHPAGDPQMGFDGNDNLFIVWAQGSPGSHDIWVNRFTPTGGWGLAQTIESDGNTADKPQIAVDSDGNANVVWQEWDGVRNNIFSNRYTYGSNWGANSQALESSSHTADDPDITVDSQGKATTAWAMGAGHVYANTYVPGSDWDGMVSIYTDTNSNNGFHTQISTNASGDTVAVWRQWDGSAWSIYANSRPEGSSTWATAQAIESMSNNADHPQITVNADGNAVAVWEHSDGSHLKIYANRFW